MLISDVSVRRPVFAAVISLMLVIIGLMSLRSMTIREYPAIERPIVSVNTNYRGAASDIVERRVTQVLEDRLAGIPGITKLSSTSFDERSSINLEFAPDRDIDDAANDVRDRVSTALNNLPDEADPPEVHKQDDNAQTTMWVNVSSNTRSIMEVSDFADRYIVDALSAVDGVAQIRGAGRRRPAMRIWVDPKRLAARGMTVTDIEDALRRENVQIPSGRLESRAREFTLRTNTGLHSAADFRNLVLREGAGDYLVRLGEVADVELAPEDIRSYSATNGVAGMSLGIVAPCRHRRLGQPRQFDVHPRLADRGRKGAWARDAARPDRDLRLPRHCARDDHPGSHDPHFDHLCVHHHGGDEFLDQHADLAGLRARDRTRRRRCHRRAREHRPPHRNGRTGIARRDQREPGDRLCGHCHDPGPGRGDPARVFHAR
jgi:hypothetical protein